jgi:hypothetical protein
VARVSPDGDHPGTSDAPPMRVQNAATTIRRLRLPQIRTNHSHGLRRTNADQQHAVEVALKAFPDRNDRSIADLCGVSHPSVSAARRQLVKSTSCEQKRLGLDGKRRKLPDLANTRLVPQRSPPAQSNGHDHKAQEAAMEVAR